MLRKVARVSSESPFATPVGQAPPPRKSFLQKNKKIILIAGAVIIILLLVFNMPDKSKSGEPEFDEVDVNGLTISAACEKVREAGWRVHEVEGTGDSSEKSDCTDDVRKVVRAWYVTDYVYLYFANEPKPDDEETSEETTGPTSEEAPAETSVEEASAGGEGSGYEAIYNEYSARLENECPNLTIDECAEISNEGVEKMAQYMYSASGTDGEYATYDSWARKLMGVYIASAQYA